MDDLYDVLGVTRSATTKEIRDAYLRLAKKVHPDVGGNSLLFRKIQEAYLTLGDKELRSAYDRSSATAESPGTKSASTGSLPVVPTLVGLDEPALVALALSCPFVINVYLATLEFGDVRAGRVIDQAPAGGTILAAGEPISVLFASNPSSTDVLMGLAGTAGTKAAAWASSAYGRYRQRQEQIRREEMRKEQQRRHKARKFSATVNEGMTRLYADAARAAWKWPKRLHHGQSLMVTWLAPLMSVESGRTHISAVWEKKQQPVGDVIGLTAWRVDRGDPLALPSKIIWHVDASDGDWISWTIVTTGTITKLSFDSSRAARPSGISLSKAFGNTSMQVQNWWNDR